MTSGFNDIDAIAALITVAQFAREKALEIIERELKEGDDENADEGCNFERDIQEFLNSRGSSRKGEENGSFCTIRKFSRKDKV